MIEKFEHLQRIPEALEWMLKGMFRSRNDRVLTRMGIIVRKINAMEAELEALDDEALKAKTPYFKEKLEQGATLDDILPEAFAVVREAGKRTLGMRHYDVQMLGGILLHRGTICEMMTGEGKTLVATCPAYLNALTGKGVHIITVNDYLASRDSEWMGRIFRFLGLTVGCIQTTMEDPEIKRQMYGCDITYGTNNEFGFDYLRDNMKVHKEELVQGELNYCIIDEVDSILIDEARTPLIISGPASESSDKYATADQLARQLKKDEHYTIDAKETSITLTDEGVSKCEELLGIDNLFSGQHMDLPHFINNALRAHYLFSKDKDYVTEGGEVVIIDEHTGRKMSGRRWSDGLHQAVEMREGLSIKRESQTLASITFQNLFRLYGKISGMTGTAMTESSEFLKIYNLDVVAVPPNRPCQRLDKPDLVYGTAKEKYEAIVSEVEERHKSGQPILIGTASIESSELASHLLTSKRIPHTVLNAKQHEREAFVVAQAGAVGAVTVATNMAGRGTDIVLGGNPEVLIRAELGDEANEDEVLREIEKRKIEFEAVQQKVKELGGLYVLGTERHDSRRIDNQLRGRSGRQGDPGESRFYLSLEDDLMRRFAPPWARNFMQKSGLSDGEPLEHSLITKSIGNAQKKVEEFNFEIRKNLLEYDEVMNEQRKFIYAVRNRILKEEDVESLYKKWVRDSIHSRIDQFQSDIIITDDVPAVIQDFRNWVEGVVIKPLDEDMDLENSSKDEVFGAIHDRFLEIYDEKEKALSPDVCRMMERFLLLQTIDHHWKEHLYAMDHVKDAIGYRGYAQVDPKVEYKREGFSMFADLLYAIKQQVTEMGVRMTVASPDRDLEMESVYHENQARHDDAGSVVRDPVKVSEPQAPVTNEPVEVTQPIVNDQVQVGRNDPCPCGSGKKYKNCCGR